MNAIHPFSVSQSCMCEKGILDPPAKIKSNVQTPAFPSNKNTDKFLLVHRDAEPQRMGGNRLNVYQHARRCESRVVSTGIVYCSGSGSWGRKFPTIRLGLQRSVMGSKQPEEEPPVHFVVVPANPKGETAVDDVFHPVNGALERAGREERVVRRIECDGSELLPVPHIRFLG